MKKILSIALIAMLALTTVFADVTFKGEASLAFAYDLDTTDYGFQNATKTDLTWYLESGKGGSEGSKDLRAVIAGEWKVKNAAISTSKITKADIIYKDVTVGLLNAGSANYAKSYYDDNGDGVADVDNVKTASTVKGFTVSYEGFKAGFGTEGNIDASKNSTWIFAETKSFEVADGASVQAAGAVLLVDGKATIFANAKGAFKNDTVNASLAADVKVADSKVALESSAKVAVAPVAVSVFAQYDEKFVLDAMVEAEWAVEDISGTVYVDVRDITDTTELDATVGCTVELEPCTIDASIEVCYDDEVTVIAPALSVSSTALIDNCTVKLAWAGADFKNDKMGAITASAKVKF